jgi:hypothetical protein
MSGAVDAREHIALAQRRVEWAAHALVAAANDLHEAGEAGAVTNGTAAELQAEAQRVAGLVRRIAGDRELAGNSRRARDSL